jgi:chromosome segregation ATPase
MPILMKSTADRYKSIAEAYLKLSDRFNQLDIAHMSLRQKIVPMIKALKKYQALTTQLKQDKAELTQTIQALANEKTTLQGTIATLQNKIETLIDLEPLLQPETQHILTEAEQQIELIEETLQEITLNSDPDLSEADRQLLETYQNDLARWVSLNESELFAKDTAGANTTTMPVAEMLPSVA